MTTRATGVWTLCAVSVALLAAGLWLLAIGDNTTATVLAASASAAAASGASIRAGGRPAVCQKR